MPLSETVLFTVDRPDGTTMRRKVGPVSEADMELARPVYEELLEMCDGDVDLLAVRLMVWLHERDVYERVCERKGLLPL